MFPAEIRQKREALGLIQKQLANALQISESTLSLWEAGAQIQQRSMDKFLRAFFDLEELRSYLSTPGAAWVEQDDRVAVGQAQK